MFHEDVTHPQKSEEALAYIRGLNLFNDIEVDFPVIGLSQGFEKFLNKCKGEFFLHLEDDWDWIREFDLNKFLGLFDEDVNAISINRRYCDTFDREKNGIKLCRADKFFMGTCIYRTKWLRGIWVTSWFSQGMRKHVDISKLWRTAEAYVVHTGQSSYRTILERMKKGVPVMMVPYFDDGFIDTIDKVLPLLEELDMRAVFAVTVNLIGKTWRNQPIVGWDRLVELSKKHDIASHSMSHTEFKMSDILESKQILEKKLNCKVDHFVFPHNRYTPEMFAEAQKHYKYVRMTEYPIVYHYIGDTNKFYITMDKLKQQLKAIR
jgi:hypothetical protein